MKLNELRSTAVVSSQKVEKVTTVTPKQLQDIVGGQICIYWNHNSELD